MLFNLSLDLLNVSLLFKWFFLKKNLNLWPRLCIYLFLCKSINFCSMYFAVLCVGLQKYKIVVFMINWPLYHFEITVFIYDSSLCCEIYFVSSLLWLVLKWYIFSHPFTYDQLLLFNLMCVTCRQHVDVSYSNNLNLLISCLNKWSTFNVIIGIGVWCFLTICFLFPFPLFLHTFGLHTF